MLTLEQRLEDLSKHNEVPAARKGDEPGVAVALGLLAGTAGWYDDPVLTTTSVAHMVEHILAALDEAGYRIVKTRKEVGK